MMKGLLMGALGGTKQFSDTESPRPVGSKRLKRIVD